MKYQDSWINGEMIEKGERECANRYDIIKAACQYIEPKTVLDIGANMCYFGLRLIEDFNCDVMAFEFNSFKLRLDHIKKSGTKKLMLLERKLTIPDLEIIASCCRFELVLALSVVHHLPGDTSEWIKAIRQCGRRTIIEFAGTDSARPTIRKNYSIPNGGSLLGYGDSHLKKNFKRPIYLYE